ncbi:MAG: FKBP-type peptidylprolyl cis-trans isomerase [Parcubacteria group bacterium]|nr:FKBP-type peptidylprolyl cis-trans isomerase [Parcubacteria group bacterium]
MASGIGLLAALFYGGTILNLFNQNPNTLQTMATETTGVKIENITNGQGDVAAAGDTVTVNYVGTLTDGKVFDSSIDRGQPFTFQLGVGQVIRGWDEGVAGMRVGGKRRLTISPDFGYGAQTVGPIPANSTLMFDVDLLKVQHPVQAQ